MKSFCLSFWKNYICKKSQVPFSFFLDTAFRLDRTLRVKWDMDCKAPHFKPRSHPLDMQPSKYRISLVKNHPQISAPFRILL